MMRLALSIAIAWHVLQLLAGWGEQQRTPHARDYASYHFAVQVASDGGDPYDKTQLEGAASLEGRPGRVPPYLYPPPFLVAMSWTGLVTLEAGYDLWFWVNELLLLLCLWAGWRLLAPRGRGAPIALLLAAAFFTPVIANHVYGQVNLLILALVLLGLWRAESGDEATGGFLVGTAGILKMSPALFVFWWLLRRRWVAAGWAIGAALAWTALSLAVLGTAAHERFFLEVLPSFGSGGYNALDVPISELLNHSPASFWHGWFPPAEGTVGLAGTARALSVLTTLGLVGWAVVCFRGRGADPPARVAQIAAIAVLALLVPVFTYEHHLVWALPAAAVAGHAVVTGALGPRWAAPVGAALAVLALHVSLLFWIRESVGELPAGAALAGAVSELKLAALLVLFAACTRVGPPAEAAA